MYNMLRKAWYLFLHTKETSPKWCIFTNFYKIKQTSLFSFRTVYQIYDVMSQKRNFFHLMRQSGQRKKAELFVLKYNRCSCMEIVVVLCSRTTERLYLWPLYTILTLRCTFPIYSKSFRSVLDVVMIAYIYSMRRQYVDEVFFCIGFRK